MAIGVGKSRKVHIYLGRINNDKTFIGFGDFILVCNVQNPADFGGFRVEKNGLFVVLPDSHVTLTPKERVTLSWHPTGDYDHPALALPCSIEHLRSFISDSGLAGCIDEETLCDVLSTKSSSGESLIAEQTVSAALPLAIPTSLHDSKIGKESPRFSIVRSAMVAQHKHEWPTIEADIADASKNGLAIAKAGTRGWWEGDAMEWARANNKLHGSATASHLDHVMRNLPTQKISIGG